LKIHYVVPHFHPDVGGVEDHVMRLAKYMTGRGHEVTVHTSRKSISGVTLPPQEDLHGILVRRYEPGLSLGYYATMFRPAIAEGDIVHAHGYAFLPADFSIRHYRGRMGAILTAHHGVRMTPPNLRGRVLRMLYDRYGLRTLRKADKVFASSDADKRWMTERRVRTEKIEVIPDGIPDEAFAPGDRSFASRRGLGDYILFLGRVHKEKCVEHLLTALARLKRPGLQLAVVGPDGGAIAALRQTAKSLGIEESVKILGLVSEEEKRGLLAGCSLLALPSLYEAQGLVILEAWAQGRPVVASRVGGVPYMVTDGTDGILYDWGDIDQLTAAISGLVDDRAAANKIGAAGKSTALRSYRWSSVAARIEQIYVEVVAGRPWKHKHK